jgi:hypothetical protein
MRAGRTAWALGRTILGEPSISANADAEVEALIWKQLAAPSCQVLG